MSATIILRNVRASTLIGVYDGEKHSPQTLKFDLELTLKQTTAALSDRLSDTVDYDEVVRALREFAKQKSHELLESLVYELAQALLDRFALREVDITAWKSVEALRPAEVAVRVQMREGERWDRDDDRYND